VASTQDVVVTRTLAIDETMSGGSLGQTGTMSAVASTQRTVSDTLPATRKTGHVVRVQDIADSSLALLPVGAGDDVVKFLYIRASAPFTLGFTDAVDAQVMTVGKEVMIDNVGSADPWKDITLLAITDDTEFRAYWMF